MTRAKPADARNSSTGSSGFIQFSPVRPTRTPARISPTTTGIRHLDGVANSGPATPIARTRARPARVIPSPPSSLWSTDPDQTFLDDRSEHPAIGAEEVPAGEPSGTRGAGRVGVVEDPVVDPDRSVKPHRVIQRRQLEASPGTTQPMSGQYGVQQGQVREIGQHADVQQLVVREFGVTAEPDLVP